MKYIKTLLLLTLFLLAQYFIALSKVDYSDLYAKNDSINIFPIEVKEIITRQLKEIWNCEKVSFYFKDSTNTNVIVNIGVIDSPPEERIEDLKLASRLILTHDLKAKYNFSEGNLVYKTITNNNENTVYFEVFTIIESIPVAENCRYSTNQTLLKQCFWNYIKNSFETKSDTSKLKNLGVERHVLHKAIVGFTISKKSEIINIYVFHSNEIVKSEMKKIAKSLKFISPAYKNGEPDILRYEIPVRFLLD